jgi:glyoxylase-like metal-dependent hydrolase (beta-lactamase superfamily II)
MTTTTVPLGALTLVRASYAEVSVPAERGGLTAEQIRAAEWAEPTWAADGEMRVGVAAWIVRTGDACVVFEPANVADEILRADGDAALHQNGFAKTLEEAGVSREEVTHVVATHLDGIGMLAWRNDDGSWSPFFPNAPIFLSARELAAIDAGTHKPSRLDVLAQLQYQGAVSATDDKQTITDGVSVEFTGGHTPGHQIARIESEGERAVFLGHLAVNPVHLTSGPCPQQHPDPETALTVLEALRDEGSLLIGPLWPAPGAGRWDGAALVAVEP